MPGYREEDVLLVRNLTDDQKQRFYCFRCAKLLKDPRQSIMTGDRYCRSCSSSTKDPPDRAIEKEIMQQEVYCRNRDEGCTWKGSFELLLKVHFLDCPHESKEEKQRLREENDILHKAQQNSSPGPLDRFLSLSEGGEEVTLDTQLADILVFKNYSGPAKDVPVINHRTTPLQVQSHNSPQDSAQDFDALAAQLEQEVSVATKKEDEMAEKISQVNVEIQLYAKKVETATKVLELKNSLYEIPAKMPCCTFTSSFTTYEHGTSPVKGSTVCLRWRIAQFTEMCANGDVVLLGPTWHTHPCGYRMRAILCPNGYGISFGKSVSVFIEVVPGPDDDLLRWPLIGWFSFFLLDLNNKNSRARVRTRRSDPENPFERPQSISDSIFACGCLEFIQIAKLKDYVKDDTIMLEFIFRPT